MPRTTISIVHHELSGNRIVVSWEKEEGSKPETLICRVMGVSEERGLKGLWHFLPDGLRDRVITVQNDLAARDMRLDLTEPERKATFRKIEAMAFVKASGVRLGVFRRWLRGATYIAYIKGFEEALRGLVRPLGRKHEDFGLACGRYFVERIHSEPKTRELVLQAQKDGLSKLAPLIIVTGMGPHELKEFMGKGQWKRVHAMSRKRIALISEAILISSGRTAPIVRSSLIAAIRTGEPWAKETVGFICRAPSSILPDGVNTMAFCVIRDEEKLMVEGTWQLAVRWRKLHRFGEIAVCMADSIRMANATGEPWAQDNQSTLKFMARLRSYEDLVAIHDRLAREQRERMAARLAMQRGRHRNMPSGMRIIEMFEVPEQAEIGGFLFKRLDKDTELLEEGNHMDHCVAGYWDSVARGECAIFSVMNQHFPESRSDRATLEIRFHRDGGCRLVQIESFKNSEPSEEAWAAARRLVRLIRVKDEKKIAASEKREAAPAPRAEQFAVDF